MTARARLLAFIRRLDRELVHTVNLAADASTDLRDAAPDACELTRVVDNLWRADQQVRVARKRLQRMLGRVSA